MGKCTLYAILLQPLFVLLPFKSGGWVTHLATALALLRGAEMWLSLSSCIRSSIMSHITFKMCQFVLVIYLRDYHFNFYLDIVVLWSFYGVLRLTYPTFQILCPTDHFFGRLLMSQDISPNWMVLLEFTYRIIQKFFRIFPMSKIVL